MMYPYKGRVTRVVDGDTLDVDLDLGFSITTHQRIRLLGVNTPEKSTDEGKAAAAWVKAWVERYGPELDVFTKTREKYGRWLAVVSRDGVELNQALIEAEIALAYDGHGARPVPSS